MIVVLATGGFDPIHSGHIEYLKAAKALGHELIVGLNSDEWLARKKGKPFMSFNERRSVLAELSCVGMVISFDDTDGTANDAIRQVKKFYPSAKIVFANGGDRDLSNTPETAEGIYFRYGVGSSTKKNSSSLLLDSWSSKKTMRDWGYWRILEDKQPDKPIKVKELVINTCSQLSDQKHFHRNEHWYVLSGVLQINTEFNGVKQSVILTAHDTYYIAKNVWHQAINIGNEPVCVLEIQYGDVCIEEDIERRNI
jgi:D-beta-D-heptose 7-phosphate kinase/D-beta-D-heptose 1-phosphate adenosyltransferase